MQDKSPVTPLATNRKIMQAHLRAMEKSGLSRAEYCRQHNLSYHGLGYWKRKADAQKKTAAHFVSVPAVKIRQSIITTQNQTAALKIDLGAEFSIEVHDDFTPATLSRIISTLRGC